MRGHPIKQHTDPALVQFVDERPEVVGGSESCGRRVVAGDLVAPRSSEGVLGYRQQLDVGEPEGADVVGDLLGQLAIRIHTMAPGREVHLVDAQRVTGSVTASRHP
jgi:hypothetical protein